MNSPRTIYSAHPREWWYAGVARLGWKITGFRIPLSRDMYINPNSWDGTHFMRGADAWADGGQERLIVEKIV